MANKEAVTPGVCFPGFDGAINHCLNGCGGLGTLRMNGSACDGCWPQKNGALNIHPISFMVPVTDLKELPCAQLKAGATPRQLIGVLV